MKKNILAVVVLILSLSNYAQEFGIVPTKLNILYRGIENPIKVVVENHSCDSVFITSNNLAVKRLYNCNYIVVPGKARSASITVGVIKNNDTILLGRHEFRVWSTPDPVAKLSGRSKGEIPKNLLFQARGLTAEVQYDFEFDVDYKITSYTAVIERDQKVIYEKEFSGNVFPAELRSQFGKLNYRDIIRFENLVATGPDNSPKEISPISFEIR